LYKFRQFVQHDFGQIFAFGKNIFRARHALTASITARGNKKASRRARKLIVNNRVRWNRARGKRLPMIGTRDALARE
jgi:hypothetical protein